MEAANVTTTASTASAHHPSSKSGAERRRYPRLVFSPKDGVTAGVCFSTPEGDYFPVQAMVMNLSYGGLGMGIPREELGGLTLAEEDLFTVVELRIAYRQVRLPLEVAAQIRWTVDADYIDHICFGCAFHGPGHALREQLNGFVTYNFPHLDLK